MHEPVFFGVSGGSGSGKSTFTRHLVDRVGPDRVSVISFDSYYLDLGHIDFAERLAVNFDHPDALDAELFVEHLDALRRGHSADVPVYDFDRYTRSGRVHRIEPRPVVVVEGILLLHFRAIAERLHRTVFLDVPAAVRMERRVRRDVVERGRLAEDVRRVFSEVVQPMHELFVEPGRALADHVIGFEKQPVDVVDRLLARVGDPALSPA